MIMENAAKELFLSQIEIVPRLKSNLINLTLNEQK